MKLGTVIPDLKNIQKYTNHVTYLMSPTDISMSIMGNQQFLLYLENIVINCILIYNFILRNIVAILMQQ